jgi:hypothetical protein
MATTLNWLYKNSAWVWCALTLYAIVVTLPHVIVQTWLGAAIQPIGLSAFYVLMATGAVGVAAICSWYYLRALSTHPSRRALIGSWVVTLALAVAAWRYLSVNNSELVHFGQYLLPGLVLIAITRSVTESLAWIAIMAGCDEGYQFWGLHWDWGIPWDFNDIYMDLLGGHLGVLLGLAFLPAVPRQTRVWRRPGVVLLSSLLAVGATLWALGLLLIYEDKANTHYWFALSRLEPKGFWFFDATWGPRSIHALTPLEGITLVLVTIFAFGRWEAKAGQTN